MHGLVRTESLGMAAATTAAHCSRASLAFDVRRAAGRQLATTTTAASSPHTENKKPMVADSESSADSTS